MGEITIDALPEVAREIAEIIGLSRTVTLVDRLGGTTFPISKRMTRLGELRFAILSDVIGCDAASALSKHYGGTNLYIPRCSKALRCLRDARIIEEFDRKIGKLSANAIVSELALAYKLSDRQIWNVLKKDASGWNKKQNQFELVLNAGGVFEKDKKNDHDAYKSCRPSA